MMVDLWLSMGTRCWLHLVYVSTFTTSIGFRDQIALRGYILNLAKHSRVPFSDTAEVKVATSPLGTASKSTHVCSFRATCPLFFSRLVACQVAILKRLDCKEHDACAPYAVMKFMTLQTRKFKFVSGRDGRIVAQRQFWIGFMEEHMIASNWCYCFYFMGDVYCFGILWHKKAHYCIITLYLIFFATFISQLFYSFLVFRNTLYEYREKIETRKMKRLTEEIREIERIYYWHSCYKQPIVPIIYSIIAIIDVTYLFWCIIRIYFEQAIIFLLSLLVNASCYSIKLY